MLTQTSVHSKVSPASPEPDGLNYNFTYQYNGPRPHAATRIGNWAYLYDANGNVIEQQWIGDQGEGHGNDWGGDNHGGRESMNLAPAAPTTNSAAVNDQNGPGNGERDSHGNFRYGDHRYGGEHGNDWGMQNPHYGQGGGPKDQTFVWDEENRLIHTYGFGGPTDYLYDYNGERALKRGEHGETWYIDRYYQIQNGHQIEKHIFVGDTRVVTRLEDGDGFDSGYEEHNIFYYHPDHLGSTTFVTTQDGHEWEHMEYTPYGQQWIDEGTDKSIITYRFTSKEYDSETGLYYYGVRYLDPATARWMSVDPELAKYLPEIPIDNEAKNRNQNLPGPGGVFNAINTALYVYAGNNPVKYVDPNGTQGEESAQEELGKGASPNQEARSSAGFQLFVATVYGEAGNSSLAAGEAVGHVIMNRVGKGEWGARGLNTPSLVIEKSGFDAYSHNTSQFQAAKNYLSAGYAGSGKDQKIDQLISALFPIYTSKVPDTTNGSVLYYSPKAQAALHQQNPAENPDPPDWDFSKLSDTTAIIPGLLSTDDFRFFKYK